MIAVEFQEVTKLYGNEPALQDVSLTVEAGTFTVFYGPPGCGKSLLVRLLAGLEKPSAGQIFLREADVTNVGPGERNLGYVPQAFALYPHYTVYDNIAYPLDLMGVAKDDSKPVVRQTAEMLRIEHLLSKHPDQLSGGEKQRVAIARGIAKHTDIFVLDDPLAGLDFKLREQLFDDLTQMQAVLEATFIYTTSDPIETLMLAEQVVVLDAGRVIEAGPLEQLYWQPRHIRTMELLGFPRANLLTGRLATRSGQVWCQTNLFEFPVEMTQPIDPPDQNQQVSIAVRPQDLVVGTGAAGALLTFQAQVVLQEDLGGEVIVYLEADRTPLVTVVGHDADHLLADDVVTIGVRPSAMVLFAPDEGQRIGQGAT